ncbi:c-type cytochrome [Parapusillimonas granuli]|uniref:C-type cytochrome n=1 Tax=Parapusillimonas granuli TaxID=380911 RepID=A0A853FYW6_9BURK|nr:c-type cytochrome [Parapusillimonas granuli]MBB5214965.1 cytochrome c553 [Parapusillimonas granuli]MEB2401176.1 c-type cytochrome [Alcaligenaceae bacterium]NYT49287.1 c-type cytochrome [Parapusillimonas granuli]
MKKLTLALAGSALVALASGASAADLAAGKAAFEKFTCASCHGADAKTSVMPTYPILAGQHRDYLEHALRAYKRGAANQPASANVRKNAIMGAMVAQLTQADIENIAAWLAAQPSPLSVRK